jgi:hypothetical protein
MSLLVLNRGKSKEWVTAQAVHGQPEHGGSYGGAKGTMENVNDHRNDTQQDKRGKKTTHERSDHHYGAALRGRGIRRGFLLPGLL